MGSEHTGRVSVVTGAGRGIGLACATELARAGSDIAICEIHQSHADAAAAALAAEFGVTARGYVADVSSWEAVASAMDAIARDFGRVDHLVNNAGIQFVSPIAEFPVEQYRQVRAVDLDGVFYAMKAVWPHLVAAGRGRIVNIASVQGVIGSPFKAAYVAAKHGVVGMTKVAAIEGARAGITVNAICPGAVMTDLVRGQAADLRRSSARSWNRCPRGASSSRSKSARSAPICAATSQSRLPVRRSPLMAAGPRTSRFFTDLRDTSVPPRAALPNRCARDTFVRRCSLYHPVRHALERSIHEYFWRESTPYRDRRRLGAGECFLFLGGLHLSRCPASGSVV
jgi:3-hydroxybutyrate dehydrogenase